MQTILVPTDFSNAALNAAEYAVGMAKTLNKRILLLNIYTLPVAYTEIPVGFDTDLMLGDAEKWLGEIRSYLYTKTNKSVEVEIVARTGGFMQELNKACEAYEPYAVVMGSQGKTASERILFGSHTVLAMKQLEWPLITVPPDVSFSTIRRVALACDLADVEATMPVKEIETMVKDFGAQLHVLNIGKENKFNPGDVFEAGVLREKLKSLNPEYHFLAAKNIDEAIIDYAEKNEIDVLIVVQKKHKFPDGLLHKSHSKKMILHCHVPVLALH